MGEVGRIESLEGEVEVTGVRGWLTTLQQSPPRSFEAFQRFVEPWLQAATAHGRLERQSWLARLLTSK